MFERPLGRSGMVTTPTISTLFSKRWCKIFRSSFSEGEGGVGQVVHFSKNGLVIGCQEGLLTILELQLEGKKRCTIDQFFAGYGSKTISLT